MQELKVEVAMRQAAVLRQEKGSAAAKLTAAQRQLRVRWVYLPLGSLMNESITRGVAYGMLRLQGS